mmetsp:Transcript_23256/g.38998  ORF Transcript_23256/g.38998 Transcript_23256/m.38998 type:complete len:109 (-) Transcript_23256:601-927(-)
MRRMMHPGERVGTQKVTGAAVEADTIAAKIKTTVIGSVDTGEIVTVTAQADHLAWKRVQSPMKMKMSLLQSASTLKGGTVVVVEEKSALVRLLAMIEGIAPLLASLPV